MAPWRAVVGAAGQGDLELARQPGAQRRAEEVPRHRLAVGRDVEGRPAADARVGARRDVADRVRAGLAGGEPGVGHLAHEGPHVLGLHEVELEVLPRGDVPVAPRVHVRALRQHAELRPADNSLGDLHPDHVDAVLALAVDPAGETVLAILLGADFTALELLEHGDELGGFGGIAEAGAFTRHGWACGCRHGGTSRGKNGKARHLGRGRAFEGVQFRAGLMRRTGARNPPRDTRHTNTHSGSRPRRCSGCPWGGRGKRAREAW